MPFWTQRGSGQIVTNAGATTSNSRGTSVTAGTVNAKGATPTQLLASTPYPSHQILVMFDDSATFIDYLVDIMVGGAGSEQVLLSNLIVSGGTGSVTQSHYYVFNTYLDDGIRLSSRCQSSTAASVVRVSCLLVHGDEQMAPPYGKVTTYGANTADSGGTSVDPGGTANTKGAWSQITASTSDPINEVYLGVGNQTNGTRTSQSWLMDIGIGGAGAEQVIIPNIALNCSSSTDAVMPSSFGPIAMHIPAGTRISARAQSEGIDATDRLFDVILYGST